MIKKYFPLLTLMVMSISTDLRSQSSETIHFGFHLNPNLSIPIYDAVKDQSHNNGYQLNLGGDLFIDLNNRIQLITGISYNFQSINQIDYGLIFLCDIDVANGAIPEIEMEPTSKSYLKDEFNMHYLGLGIESRFKFSDKANHLFYKIGIDNLFHLFNHDVSNLSECGNPLRVMMSTPENSPSKFILQLKTGFGYEFNIGNENKMYLETQLKYSANQVLSASSITGQQFQPRIVNVGMNVGMMF